VGLYNTAPSVPEGVTETSNHQILLARPVEFVGFRKGGFDFPNAWDPTCRGRTRMLGDTSRPGGETFPDQSLPGVEGNGVTVCRA